MTSSWTCEISGESLLTMSKDAVIVATPSGHICQKRLLLEKLSENGGMDPFETDRPLSEDDLIELQGGSKKTSTTTILTPPPSTASTSIGSTLGQLQLEYDAVVLELFDTRKSLTETRRELSHALYQNDASVRVIARIAAERDQARLQLQNWQGAANNGVGGTGGAAPTTAATTTAAVAATAGTTADNEGEDENEPAAKKAKLSIIPEEDFKSMLSTWEELHVNRKSKQKKLGKEAMKPDQIANMTLLDNAKKSAKIPRNTTAPTALASSLFAENETIVVQVSKGLKQLLVYKRDEAGGSWGLEKEHATLSCACAGKTVDMLVGKDGEAMAAAGLANGMVDIVNILQNNVVATANIDDDTSGGVAAVVVDVRIHPDKVHVVAATATGRVVLMRMATVEIAAAFQEPDCQYVSCALHPDGFIYVAGDEKGNLLLWDFKSQTRAGKLEDAPSSSTPNPVLSVEFSNNGYHIAAAYQDGKVVVWDLRKQAKIATLNDNETESEEKLDTVLSVQFDEAGKYLAYSGNRNDTATIRITTVKEWGNTATLDVPKRIAGPGLQWGPSWIAMSCLKTTKKTSTPEVAFFGLKEN